MHCPMSAHHPKMFGQTDRVKECWPRCCDISWTSNTLIGMRAYPWQNPVWARSGLDWRILSTRDFGSVSVSPASSWPGPGSALDAGLTDTEPKSLVDKLRQFRQYLAMTSLSCL